MLPSLVYTQGKVSQSEGEEGNKDAFKCSCIFLKHYVLIDRVNKNWGAGGRKKGEGEE